MKKILLILMGFSCAYSQEILKIDNKSIDLEYFEKNQKNSLNLLGIEKTINNFIDFEMLKKYALQNDLEKNQGYLVKFNNGIVELKDSFYYPKKDLQNFLKKQVERSKIDKKVQIIMLANTNKSQETIQKANNILNEISSGKISFDEATKKYSDQYNPALFIPFNNYDSFLQDLVYNTEKGQTSKVAINDIYVAIAKVYDQRESLGELLLSQIVIKSKENKEKANKIYAELNSGLDFVEAVKKYSEDNVSKKSNGMIRANNNFDDNLYNNLKDKSYNQITQPILIENDYYIFKIDEIINYDANNNFLNKRLLEKIKETPLMYEMEDKLISFIKEELKYNLNQQMYQKLLNLTKNRQGELLSKTSEETLFTINSENIKVNNLAQELNEFTKITDKKIDTDFIVKNQIESYISQNLISYYSNNFDLVPSLKNNIQLIKDEIAINFVMDYLLENEAENKDLQQEYFNKHKDKFILPERYNVSIYECLNKDIAKNVEKSIKNNKEKEILEQYKNKTDDQNNLLLFLTKGKYSKNSEQFPKKTNFKEGVQKVEEKGKVYIINIHSKENSRNKSFEESKQEIKPLLKSELVSIKTKEMKAKTKIELNQESIKILKNKYKN